MKNYKQIIPKKYHNVSYEKDVVDGIKSIVTSQISERAGLYLYGGAGVGKTHIACAIATKILDSGIDVVFYNTGDFLEKLREEFSSGTKDDDDYRGLFRETMDFEGVIIFDDIGSEKVSEWAIERLYLIINKKWEDVMPIIFTSNVDMEILSARLGDRIASRVKGMCEIIHLEGQDKRINMNIKNNETIIY